MDLSKKMQTQVSDDGNFYTSGKIYSYSSYLDGLMYIEDVYTCFYILPRLRHNVLWREFALTTRDLLQFQNSIRF